MGLGLGQRLALERAGEVYADLPEFLEQAQLPLGDEHGHVGCFGSVGVWGRL